MARWRIVLAEALRVVVEVIAHSFAPDAAGIWSASVSLALHSIRLVVEKVTNRKQSMSTKADVVVVHSMESGRTILVLDHEARILLFLVCDLPTDSTRDRNDR